MNIGNATIFSLIRYSLYSGTFALLSFLTFSATYYYLNPKIEIFMRFFDSDNLGRWAHYNLLSFDSLYLTVSFLICSIILSSIGLISAILAKSFHDKAVDLLKVEIVT